MGSPIRLEEVSHRYGRRGESSSVLALRDVSLSIATGDFAILMGPSGSGKSTLLHLIGGVDRPTSGRILLGEIETTRLDERERTLVRRSQIGFIFQFFNLIPTLTVEENVAFPLRLNGASPSETRDRVAEVLDRVQLRDRGSHYPAELSGGEMQRVAIGRAIAHRPPILLADEPTGNLDTKTGDRILDLIREIHEIDHPTIVFATHSLHAASYGQYRIEIVDGVPSEVST